MRTFIGVVLLILTASCQKYVAPTEDLTDYVKTATVEQNSTTTVYVYKYDFAGRMISRTTQGEVITYEYPSNGMVEVINGERIFSTIGARYGYKESTTYSGGMIDYRYDRSYFANYTYYYNKQGTLEKTIEIFWSPERNMIEERDGKDTIFYDYYPIADKQDLGARWYRHNQHLMRQATYVGSINKIHQYEYQIDNRGRVTVEYLKVNGTLSRTIKYTY